MKPYRNGLKKVVAAGLVVLLITFFTGCENKPDIDSQKTNTTNSGTEMASDTGTTDDVISKTADEISVSDSMAITGMELSSTEKQKLTEEQSDIYEDNYEEWTDDLTLTQRNSINMLNYMSALTQKISASNGNQFLLETAYSSLVNDIYPNAVDTKTQAQITSLMDTIEDYRMITAKRERLKYIYEQNCAQAFRQAIPSPVGLLSTVQSGSILKAAVSVLYMTVDATVSYKAATSKADQQYLQEGWELDDQEASELHNSTKNALVYMLNMVRDYDFDGDYALSEEAIQNFVKWCDKPDTQLVSKIEWLEANEVTYYNFGSYWLELVRDYYNSGDYEKCLRAISQYESVSTRIYRKDLDKAKVLPMIIISAKETLDNEKYKEIAERYCSEIYENTKDADWSLRYFAAQIYMDLYSLTADSTYLDNAYKIVLNNVNVLVDEQRNLNKEYLTELQTVTPDKEATKREKEEAKEYNKFLKAERKIALPPVSEALYINADLLFALAEEMDISAEEQGRIEAILHENGSNIFLTQTLDRRFWFENKPEEISENEIEVSFNGKDLSIPAVYVTDRSSIQVTVSGTDQDTIIEDWLVTKVERPKKSEDCSEFIVTFESEEGKKYKYQDGEMITIKVTPIAEMPDQNMIFQYHVTTDKNLFIFNDLKFERETK